MEEMIGLRILEILKKRAVHVSGDVRFDLRNKKNVEKSTIEVPRAFRAGELVDSSTLPETPLQRRPRNRS